MVKILAGIFGRNFQVDSESYMEMWRSTIAKITLRRKKVRGLNIISKLTIKLW